MIEAITFDLDGVYFPDGKVKFIQHFKYLASLKKKPSVYFCKVMR